MYSPWGELTPLNDQITLKILNMSLPIQHGLGKNPALVLAGGGLMQYIIISTDEFATSQVIKVIIP